MYVLESENNRIATDTLLALMTTSTEKKNTKELFFTCTSCARVGKLLNNYRHLACVMTTSTEKTNTKRNSKPENIVLTPE